MSIGITRYFHKTAGPMDIASTSGVSFAINHIAAVALPVLLGVLWLVSSAAVFLCGTVMALNSLGLSRFIPSRPAPGNEFQGFTLPLKSALKGSHKTLGTVDIPVHWSWSPMAAFPSACRLLFRPPQLR